MDVRILYRDADLLVAFKPYGVLSERHDSQPNLPALLYEQCGCEVYPVHRLDKTTEGLTLYALNSAAAAALSAAIADGSVEKEYLAAADGELPPHGELSDLLYYDRARGKSYVVTRTRRGVKEARLSYERLMTAELDGAIVSLLRVKLMTGRTHQIRVQFASRKHPLAGDRRYGSTIRTEKIALCACKLRFTHPKTGERMTFSAAPENEVFSRFGNMEA